MQETIAEHNKITDFINHCVVLGIGEQVPPVLYHYSSNYAFLNMLSTDSLWVSHIRYTNDKNEFQYGIDRFVNSIDKLYESNHSKELIDLLKKAISRERERPQLKPFVFCLSKQKDKLSQWRGYGEDGLGLSIGFSTQQLIECKSFNIHCVPIIYASDDTNNIINTIIAEFNILIASLTNLNIPISDPEWIRALALALLQVAFIQSLRFKENSWHEEEEWRFAILTNNSIKIRHSPKGLIPFIECTLNKPYKCIKEIVVGPKSDFEQQEHALEILKSIYNADFNISKSDLSLR